MVRLRVAALLGVLALAGCGSEDESAQESTFEPVKSPAADDEPAAVGGPPTVEPAPSESMPWAPPPPTVIASGRTARGDPFEVVFYGTEKYPCYTILLPARRLGEAFGACGDSLPLRPRGAITATGAANLGGGENGIQGVISPDVDSVSVSFEREGKAQTLDAASEQISRALLREAGIRGRRGIFIAFLPSEITAEDVTATAYDAGGEAIGTTTWSSIGF